MKTSPIRRGLALLLCCQPLFWMSNVALAQSLQAGSSSTLFGGPAASSEGESDSLDAGPFESGLDHSVRRSFAETLKLPAVDAIVDPDTYVCGPSDVLDLNFWGLQNFKLRVTIDLEGRVFVPKAGYFDLKGKTLSEARRMMRQSVARYYPRLSFDMTLADPRTFLVQVVDDVAHPGSYPAHAVERVATIIARAGGFGPNASRRRIEIRRRDGTTVRADLLLYSQTGDVKYNPYLLDGDVVRVPFEEVAATVTGAVNRPGRYELTETRDLAELIKLAGGTAPTMTQLLPVSIVRREENDRQDQKLVDFTRDGTIPAAALEHEDIVRIPSVTELQQSVTVIGAVSGATPSGGGTAPDEASATRRVPFVEGDTVRSLLERVGGVGNLADLNGSYIVRNGTSVPVDLYTLLVLRDMNADKPIELGDALVVPFKRRNIIVSGAVFKPGEYPYNPSFGISEYLSLAGGTRKDAKSVSDLRVVTPSGELKPYKKDLKVEPGSTLVVPERNFSRAEVVQILLGAASIIISGVAVTLTAVR